MLLALALVFLVIGASFSQAAPPPAAPLEHISGSARKMRMYIKNTYLQLEPNGSVSGVRDDTSKHTVFQRSSVTSGQVKIQGVATCMYLCMDTCGIPYAGKEFTDECVFNEAIQEHNYNTYSSAKYSNSRRTLYLGLTKKGLPRRVQIRAGGSLGKLSGFTRVLTLPLTRGEAEEVLGGGGGRRRCPHAGGPARAETGRCRRPPTPPPPPPQQQQPPAHLGPRRRRRKRKRCREGAAEEECRRALFLRRGAPNHHRVRHRKHRTAEDLLPEDPLDDEDDLLLVDDSSIDHESD